MRLAAYSLRLGGPRSYENGMIDIGAVVLDGDEFTHEFYRMFQPDDNKSYRPGDLRLAGVSFKSMYEEGVQASLGCLDFLEWADDHPGVWCFDSEAFPSFINGALRRHERSPRFTRSASITSLYDILRAFGVRGPTLADHIALMSWVQVDALNYHSLNALEQAKQSALTLRKLRDKLSANFEGEGIVPAEPLMLEETKL